MSLGHLGELPHHDLVGVKNSADLDRQNFVTCSSPRLLSCRYPLLFPNVCRRFTYYKLLFAMATVAPPPSKRQRREELERTQVQADVTAAAAVELGSLKARFIDSDGNQMTDVIEIPLADATEKNVSLLLNTLLGRVLHTTPLLHDPTALLTPYRTIHRIAKTIPHTVSASTYLHQRLLLTPIRLTPLPC